MFGDLEQLSNTLKEWESIKNKSGSLSSNLSNANFCSNKALKQFVLFFQTRQILLSPSAFMLQATNVQSEISLRCQCFSKALARSSLRREIMGRGSSFKPAAIMALS
ncbi:hypothetical protein ILYODFUR_021899 [Ilyodon furcidens]|uniref:Uncharacterized protein n=1 Tax=Ilyodon furcidens TaxID=33524 RepID=A0ABV0UVE9_9TELE